VAKGRKVHAAYGDEKLASFCGSRFGTPAWEDLPAVKKLRELKNTAAVEQLERKTVKEEDKRRKEEEESEARGSMGPRKEETTWRSQSLPGTQLPSADLGKYIKTWAHTLPLLS